MVSEFNLPLSRVLGVRAMAGEIVYIGTGEFNVGGNAAMNWQPIQVGVKILVVASCFML